MRASFWCNMCQWWPNCCAMQPPKPTPWGNRASTVFGKRLTLACSADRLRFLTTNVREECEKYRLQASVWMARMESNMTNRASIDTLLEGTKRCCLVLVSIRLSTRHADWTRPATGYGHQHLLSRDVGVAFGAGQSVASVGRLCVGSSEQKSERLCVDGLLVHGTVASNQRHVPSALRSAVHVALWHGAATRTRTASRVCAHPRWARLQRVP